MADNRMYLRCRGCGEAMVLAKMHTSTGWYSVMSAEQKGRELLDFIEKHHTCCNNIDDYARHVETDRDFKPFDLIYENDPDFALGEHYMEKNREKVIKELDSEL